MSVAVRAASSVPRLFVRSSSVRLWLAIWGVLAALYGCTHLTRHVVFPIGKANATSPYLLPEHAAGVKAAEGVLDRGGPLLLGSRVPYGTSKHPAHDYYSLGQGDQGIYVVLPLMGRWLGLTSPRTAMKWLLIALFVPLIALYPLLFFELAGSALVAALSPLLLLRTINSIDGLDVYWLSAWTTLAFVPLLLLVASRWTFRRAPAVAAIVLAASVASTVRIGAGLVVLAVALPMSLFVERGFGRRLALVAVCTVAWIAGSAGITLLQHHRNAVVGVKLADVNPSAWQTVYAGLGWINNPYGIVYGPSSALAVGESKHELKRLVEHEPGFVFDAFATKAREVERDALSRYALLWILLPFALTFGEHRRKVRRLTTLLAPGLAVAFLAPVLAVPERRYETPLDGILTVGSLLAAGWAVHAVREWSPWLTGRGAVPWSLSSAMQRREPLGAIPMLPMIMILVIALIPWLIPRSAVSTHAREIAFYAPTAAPLTPPSAVTGRVERTWSFSRGLPRGWRLPAGWQIHGIDGATRVEPSDSTALDVLQSPSLHLGSGPFRIVVNGVVEHGGLRVGLMDDQHHTLTSRRGFWSARGDYAHDRMTVRARGGGRASQIALSRWGPTTNPSWTIKTISILRISPGGSRS